MCLWWMFDILFITKYHMSSQKMIDKSCAYTSDANALCTLLLDRLTLAPFFVRNRAAASFPT